MKLHCPYCRTLVDAEDAERTHCPHCGRNIAWLRYENDFIVNGVDLWRLGRGQRMANRCLVVLGIVCLAGWLYPASGLLLILPVVLLYIGLTAGLQELHSAFAAEGRCSWGKTLFLMIPGVNMLALIGANIRAVKEFRRIRLPWRPFGWSERQLLAAFAHVFCRTCGYNLTGNQSGRCPECGSPTEQPVSSTAGSPSERSVRSVEVKC